MNRNFFIRLTFAAHRVADAFSEEDLKQEVKESANIILADLILFVEKEGISREKKYELAHHITRQIDILLVYLDKAKQEGWVLAENFSILEIEYGRLKDFLEVFESTKEEEPEPVKRVAAPSGSRFEKASLHVKAENSAREKSDLSERQRRILEFLKRKDTAQVWEIQKVLPQVTKRTLRRDLDSLLQLNLVERKGEWNSVVYELKEKGVAV